MTSEQMVGVILCAIIGAAEGWVIVWLGWKVAALPGGLISITRFAIPFVFVGAVCAAAIPIGGHLLNRLV